MRPETNMTAASTEKRISCIIPAYNEGARIGHVLETVIGHPLLDEVIVVNDGSTDNTRTVIERFKGVRLVSFEKNRGKCRAVAEGLKQARNGTVMFIDSDLIGLTREDIGNLIGPVQSGAADMTISLRGNAPWLWRLIGLDFISGERVFDRQLLMPHLDQLVTLPGFGLETFTNQLAMKNHLGIRVVKWPGVISPFPQAKFGVVRGTRRLLGMIAQIVKVGGFFGVIRMIFKMLSMRVK